MKLFILSVLFDLFNRTHRMILRWASRIESIRDWAWQLCTDENLRQINERTTHITF